MALLMIVCPRTRRSIPTNVGERAASAMKPGEAREVGPCPYCGGQHTWTARDTFPLGRPRGRGSRPS